MEQQILILFAAILAGLTVTSVFSRVNLSLSTSPSALLTDYVSYHASPDLVEQFGRWLLRRYPSLTALINLERHTRWLVFRWFWDCRSLASSTHLCGCASRPTESNSRSIEHCRS